MINKTFSNIQEDIKCYKRDVTKFPTMRERG